MYLARLTCRMCGWLSMRTTLALAQFNMINTYLPTVIYPHVSRDLPSRITLAVSSDFVFDVAVTLSCLDFRRDTLRWCHHMRYLYRSMFVSTFQSPKWKKDWGSRQGMPGSQTQRVRQGRDIGAHQGRSGCEMLIGPMETKGALLLP